MFRSGEKITERAYSRMSIFLDVQDEIHSAGPKAHGQICLSSLGERSIPICKKSINN